jgi:hypothetical protein
MRKPTGPKVDLVGKHFGKLTVRKMLGVREDTHEYQWECSCECNNSDPFVTYTSRLTNKKRGVKSCGCLLGEVKRAQSGRHFEQINGSYWFSLKYGAARRNLAFTITQEEAWNQFTLQGGKCALSGEPLTLTIAADMQRGLQTASLDRKDSSLGYVSGNIQWVHKVINEMKSDQLDHDFISWCCKVTLHNQREQS